MIIDALEGDRNKKFICDNIPLESFERYYRLYEYTDDISVLEDNPLYPGLTNYVKTGILTKEELLDALKYDKSIGQ